MKRILRMSKILVGMSLLTVFLGWGSAPTSVFASPGADDSLITSQVLTAFFHEPTLRASRLNVNTCGGVVVLTGFSEKAVDVAIATELANAIPGVVRVENKFLPVKQ